jgi:hypothetical protein
MPAPLELIALMERFNQLGRMLPNPEDPDEVYERRDECALILREMKTVQREIDRILDANRLIKTGAGK